MMCCSLFCSKEVVRSRRVLILLVLVLAAALRFYGLNWDGGIGAHPDERYVVGVAEMLALVAGLVRDADPLLVGRALAALFDLGTVALTFVLGRRVYGGSVGLLAAAFVALMVLHVQQAHFYTADVLLTLFVLGALFFAVRLAESGRALDACLAGAWAGLALGTKFSAALLVLPLGAACVVAPGEPVARWKRGLASGGAALVAFALTNPFALIAFPTFWRNVAGQAAIARGAFDVLYTRQFHATWPYLYSVVQQLRWGMGWPLGLLVFGGLVYAVWGAVREPPRRVEWVLLVWVVPGLAFVGALYAKFPRYLLPLTPLLALYGARLLLRGMPLRMRRLGNRRLDNCFHIEDAPVQRHRSQPLPGWWASFLIYSLLIYSFLHCLAFANLYRSPHPWLVASKWFYEHVPRGAVVAVEQWDHPLPLDATGYDVRELPVFDEDTPEKWAVMMDVLTEADYAIIASRRGYATLARWPERYPIMARYYGLLFEGRLGFEPVACFGRAMRLGPLALVDAPANGLGFELPEFCQPDVPFVLHLGRLDESFVVYDHPQAMLFQRTQDGLPLDLSSHSH